MIRRSLDRSLDGGRDLHGTVVLITGAARGIGAGLARALSHRGAQVALVGLEPDLLAEVTASLPGEAVWFEADVRDGAALDRAVAGTIERYGRLDVTVANAGIATVGEVATLPADDFERVIDVNLNGVVRTARSSLPHLTASRGYLLCIASMAAKVHLPLMASYAASKAGVEAFANSLRSEVAPAGVAVGVAYFSFIDTDMVRAAFEDPRAADQRKGLADRLTRPLPLAAAVDALVDAIQRRRRTVIVPKVARGAVLAPGAVQAVVERVVRRSGTGAG